MRSRRFASLFLAAFGLFGQPANATRTPLPNLTNDLTSSLIEFHPTTDESVPANLWLIESVYPLGRTDNGSHLDLVVLIAPETHTRALCVVQSPLGLDYVSIGKDGEVYWHVQRNRWGPFNQNVRRIHIGDLEYDLDDAGVHAILKPEFGGGQVLYDALALKASDFWNRPTSGSVMDPADISSLEEFAQNQIIQDYIDHNLSSQGVCGYQQDRGEFSNPGGIWGEIGLRMINEPADWALFFRDAKEGNVHWSDIFMLAPVIPGGLRKLRHLGDVGDVAEYGKLYRGVPSHTKRGKLALQGTVKPRGSDYGMDAYWRHVHADPNVVADVTSWSRSKEVARRYGDVLLEVDELDVANRIIRPHPDPHFKPTEMEVLLRGVLYNVRRVE